MSKAMTMATALATGATVLAFWSGALGQTKASTQADFDQCNREAQMAMGVSASPRAGASVTTPRAEVSATTPGGATASGSVLGSTGAAGATGATGSVSGGSTISGGSTTAAGSGVGEAQLRGMASGGASDPGYQTAYRDCMRRRGF